MEDSEKPVGETALELVAVFELPLRSEDRQVEFWSAPARMASDLDNCWSIYYSAHEDGTLVGFGSTHDLDRQWGAISTSTT